MQRNIFDIEKIRQSIFEYNIEAILQNFENVFNEISELLIVLDENNQRQLSGILRYINISLSNEDYLLFADILLYELKPFVQRF